MIQFRAESRDKSTKITLTTRFDLVSRCDSCYSSPNFLITGPVELNRRYDNVLPKSVPRLLNYFHRSNTTLKVAVTIRKLSRSCCLRLSRSWRWSGCKQTKTAWVSHRIFARLLAYAELVGSHARELMIRSPHNLQYIW